MLDISNVFDILHNKNRPNAQVYIDNLFPDYIEMSGDRLFGDDSSITCGIATYNSIPVTIIGQHRGRNTKENIQYNFSMNKPEGYRKSLRLMKQAEKFHRPIICFVDTIGAFLGREAEERGQGFAIANNLMNMLHLKTPIISILIGYGGSGGALALCISDEIAALEYSVLSVISPEACANILWKDISRKMEAADMLKMTSHDLKKLGIVDIIINEPTNGAHTNPDMMVENMRIYISKALQVYINSPINELLKKRYEKFRNFDYLYLKK